MIEAGTYTERRPVLDDLIVQWSDSEKAPTESAYRIVTDTIYVITGVGT